MTVANFGPECCCFKKDPNHAVFTTGGEAVLPQILDFQLWAWNYRDRCSGYDFCIYLFVMPALSQTAHICTGCELCFLAYMVCLGRHFVEPFLRIILYLWDLLVKYWKKLNNLVAIKEWLCQYCCGMEVVPSKKGPRVWDARTTKWLSSIH